MEGSRACEVLDNVSAYLMFYGAKRSKIWVEALERAVTRYAVLADVFLFFFPTAVGIVLKNFKISFSVLGEGQRGLGGECPSPKLLILFSFQTVLSSRQIFQS